MNIADHFGKRRREPTLPPAPNLAPTPVDQKTAQALTFLNGLSEEVHYLREENSRLRADLNLALMRNRDLEQLHKMAMGNLEQYRRFAVGIRTHLVHIVDSAQRANNAAMEAEAASQAELQTDEPAQE